MFCSVISPSVTGVESFIILISTQPLFILERSVRVDPHLQWYWVNYKRQEKGKKTTTKYSNSNSKIPLLVLFIYLFPSIPCYFLPPLSLCCSSPLPTLSSCLASAAYSIVTGPTSITNKYCYVKKKKDKNRIFFNIEGKEICLKWRMDFVLKK